MRRRAVRPPQPQVTGPTATGPTATGADSDRADSDRAESADIARSGSAEAESNAAERVVFFSDAMVAIAITLLALGLPVPHGVTNHALLTSFGDADHRSAYTAFLISFLVIAGHWGGHRRIFRYVSRLENPVYELNMLWLLMMILTPFATRLLAGNGGFGVRLTFYALIQIIASSCLLLINRELVGRDLLRADAPATARHRDSLPALTVIGMFLLSIPVAFATGWAYWLWVVIPAIVRVSRRIRREPR